MQAAASISIGADCSAITAATASLELSSAQAQ
jgi:hypothetical protein